MHLLAVLLAAPLAVTAFSDNCTQPTGIDFGGGVGCRESSDCVPSSSFGGIVEGFVLRDVVFAVGAVKPGLSGLETPIVNHWTASNIGQVYSAMAAYEPEALELWGRKSVSDARRRCSDGLSEDDYQLHRRVTMAYTCLWVFSSVHVWEEPVGGAEVPLRALAATWGINFDICDLSRESPSDAVDSCDDNTTPWGLALELVQEILDWMKRDGWNRSGDLSGAQNNQIPYEDWRSEENRYVPVNDPWTLVDPTKWQPLMEHNNVGFMFHQEHVTPHIGDTAVSFFFPDEEICQKSEDLQDPGYDFDSASMEVINRVAQLDQRKKARIELYDDKLNSLSPAVGQYYARIGVASDDFAFVIAQAANIHALREGTILAWRAKVMHNSVRPSTYIRSQFSGATITSYGGPDVGQTVDLKTDDWQGYKRVMPHAEFPSGSSCLCRAFADTLKILTGETGEFSLLPELVLVRQAGSSSVEANMPESHEVFKYTSWDKIVEDCGQSRLDGGMHFEAAVPGGEELCSDIGSTVANAFLDLSQGIVPPYLVDFDAPEVKELRCGVPVIGGANGGGGNSSKTPKSNKSKKYSKSKTSKKSKKYNSKKSNKSKKKWRAMRQ